MKFSIKDFFSECDQIRSSMRTSLIEMLELPKLWSHDYIYNNLNHVIKFCWHVMHINYDDINFISKYLYFKRAWGSHFCWHHKIVTFFIKTIFINSRKVKRIRNFVSKCSLFMHGVIILNMYFLM